MTEERMDGPDERVLAEDLEPTDEAAQDVTGGAERANVSEMPVVKYTDKATP